MTRRGNCRLRQLIPATLLLVAGSVHAESCTGWSALWGPCDGAEQTQAVFKIPAGCSGGLPGAEPAARTRSCTGGGGEVAFSATITAGEIWPDAETGYLGSPTFWGLSQAGSVTITKAFPASCGLRAAYENAGNFYLFLESSCVNDDDAFRTIRFTHNADSRVWRREDADFHSIVNTSAWYYLDGLPDDLRVGDTFTLEFMKMPPPVQCESYRAEYGSCDGTTKKLRATVSPEFCTLPPDGQGEPLTKSCSEFDAAYEADVTAGRIYGSIHGSHIGYQAPAGNVGGNLLAAGTVNVTKDSDDIGNIGQLHARNAGEFILRLAADKANEDDTFRSVRLTRSGVNVILKRADANYTTVPGEYVQWRWTGLTSNPIHPLSSGDTFNIAFALNSQPCTGWSLGSWGGCAADPSDSTRNIQTRTVAPVPSGCAPPPPNKPAQQHVCDDCLMQGGGQSWNFGCFHQLTTREVCEGTWGNWTPGTGTQCPGTTVTQTSTCTNPATLTRTRERDGTKTAGC